MSGNPLKKLAGETAIYGMSTILARIINFFFVPLYTRVLAQAEYGTLSEFMAYVAVLQVVLVLGLETGSFRYASKGFEPKKVFANALSSVFTVSFVALLLLTVFSSDISSALGYPAYPYISAYLGIILFLDCTCSIIFARLRHEGKAWRFAIVKTVKIITETACNFGLFFLMPGFYQSHPDSALANFIPTTPDFTYPLIAILISCVVMVVLLIPDIARTGLQFDRKLWKGMMLYSLPLMVAGLPGIINEFMDRLLFRFCLPETLDWRAELGIYQAAVKLAVIMNLFIQMFRFAAEPFFFARSKEKGSRELYATVMTHFVAFCMLIFLGVTLFSGEIGLILGKDFRTGLHILPIMLLSYMLLGVSFNVSMWYKLADKTSYAIYITLFGVVITAVVNIVFMPMFSYVASAWGHLLSYLGMLGVSLYFGNKYYPIPYRWGRVLLYVAIALAIYGVSLLIPEVNFYVDFLVHGVLVLIYIAAYLKIEKINPMKLIRK